MYNSEYRGWLGFWEVSRTESLDPRDEKGLAPFKRPKAKAGAANPKQRHLL